MKRARSYFLFALLLALFLLVTVSCGVPEMPDGTDDPIGPAGPAAGTEMEEISHDHDHDRETEASPVTYAPDFEVLDKDGKTVKLSDFRGKPVVINFWATWCPPCKAELPDFNEAATTYADDVVFLMVNLTDGARDTVSGVKTFMSANDYTFPVYFDTTYSAANAYRVSSIPMTCFVSAEGVLVKQQVGMISASALEAGIQQILN
ncbi:MAG: TlpA family protein disulfide reductase [Clostridia bacterium]|nr:TlpA family protein disulfide reductase [Clostridia bacterium]